MNKQTKQAKPKVLITVDGGVASFASKGAVDVMILDYDTMDDNGLDDPESAAAFLEENQKFLADFPEAIGALEEIAKTQKENS